MRSSRPGAHRGSTGLFVTLIGLLLVALGVTVAVADRTSSAGTGAGVSTPVPVRPFVAPRPTHRGLAPQIAGNAPQRPTRTMEPPTAIAVPGHRTAPVVAVGVRADHSLVLPPVGQVGWWAGGSTPDGPGSTVLAAHLDDDRGRLGVFAGIGVLRPGDRVVVALTSGRKTYRVTSVQAYRKSGLPKSLFGRTGPARLVMITCGGTYRPDRGYSDNIVAIATSSS
jgi:sortase family protein